MTWQNISSITSTRCRILFSLTWGKYDSAYPDVTVVTLFYALFIHHHLAGSPFMPVFKMKLRLQNLFFYQHKAKYDLFFSSVPLCACKMCLCASFAGFA